MSANEKARLVVVKNPFQPWNGRVIKEIPAGVKLRNELIGDANIGCDIYTSVDGKTIPIDDYEVVGGEIITVSPVVGKGGGKILGLVAMVALAVLSYGVAGVAGGTTAGMWGATIQGATMSVWGYVAASAVMMVGGTLINKAFYSMPNAKDTQRESTYSWSGVQTMEGQTNPIQLTYGKVLSAGQTIAKFVQTIDNKEYLNWLLACGEGELEFSNILINDNPVDYYNGMELETRSGTNDQEIIEHFNDTYFTKSLGYQLNDDDVRTDTAQGTGTEGLIVKIEFSTGLYCYNDKGKLKNAWVDLKIEYRLKNGEWKTFVETRVEDKKSSAIRKEFRIDNLTPGEYEVRCQVVARSHKVTDTKASVRCYWSALTSIVYDDFTYPNIALIGIRALATDQISGAPTIKFIKERRNVWVYNPNTEQYEQRPANNPAWACYDLLHQASRLKNVNTNEYEFDVRGVPAHSILYEQFNEWAQFCEDKKYYVNIELTTIGEMLNTINDNIASIGHGMVVRFGTKYGCVWYCKKQPVQMFGMGNIISGTFKEDFLETTNRANCVEITYTDADKEYNREVITIYGDNYDTDATENATQVTFNGITSYEQAFREGKYQLYANKYQLRTVSFEANVDAIACTIGDVVLVAHDVPQWTHSGRIYDVDVNSGTFRLPVELTTTTGNIRLMYRTVNDNLYTINVSVIENGDGWCTVKGTVNNKEDAPQKGDIFDIGLTEVGSKPFIVTNITRAQDFTRNITGVEYVESIYEENYTIPPIEYSELESSVAQNVTGLNGNRVTYVTSDGRRTSRLFASWNPAENGGRYSLFYSDDEQQTWNILQNKSPDCEYQSDINAEGDIYIKVVTTLGITQSTGVVYGGIPAGDDELPPDVKSLDTEVLSDGTRRYFWGFDYPTPNDIAGFRMKYLQGTQANWDIGYDVQDGLITMQPYETTTVRQGEHVVMIKAVDNAGNESENYAYCIVNLGNPIEDNVLLKKDFSVNLWAECETNGEILTDGNIRSSQSSYHWNNPNASYWGDPNDMYWEESYNDFYVSATLIAPASGYFYLLYEIYGAYNLTYKNESTDELFKPYSTKVIVNAGDRITVRFESPASDKRTVLKKLVAVIDVPDRLEHFENVSISANGTELPIKTSNYKTTAVRLDGIADGTNAYYNVERVSDEPCIVKVYTVGVSGGNLTKQYINCVADITWQGYENKTI